jgi:hypothetical protein
VSYLGHEAEQEVEIGLHTLKVLHDIQKAHTCSGLASHIHQEASQCVKKEGGGGVGEIHGIEQGITLASVYPTCPAHGHTVLNAYNHTRI